jgi:oxygen-dependent protoporphyrinogen oxidase
VGVYALVHVAEATSDGVQDVVVVGAGVSGLCIALALETKHAGAAPRLLVTEAKERVGGNITTVSVRRRPSAAVRGPYGALAEPGRT